MLRKAITGAVAVALPVRSLALPNATRSIKRVSIMNAASSKMQKAEDRSSGWPTAGTAIDTLVKLLFIVLTALVAIIAYQGREVLKSITDHEVRITKIEASRYTVEDARRDADSQRLELKEFISLNIKPMQETLIEIKQAVKENRDARLKQ